MNLKAMRAAALKAAQDIVALAQAESRDLTADASDEEPAGAKSTASDEEPKATSPVERLAAEIQLRSRMGEKEV